jgi:serine protease Do
MKWFFAFTVLLFGNSGFSAELGRSDLIERATQATVLIKANLKHGVTEDGKAKGRWSGSGFVIDKARGWVLTNAHVAGYGAVELRVRFKDQKKFTNAKRVFLDTKHDVAVISVDPEVIPDTSKDLGFYCDYKLRRGDGVFSIGHPEGQEFTASLGVLSGEKDFHVDGSFYTTDLVTEAGSSGGPVIELGSGHVVGMMTATFSSSDLGFMTKSKEMCSIIGLMRAERSPARPRFGFQTMIVDGELSPVVGSIFDQALDLVIGDEILSWNGNLWHPESNGDLGDAMRGYGEDRMQLSVMRDGSEVLVDVPVQKGRSAHEKDWLFVSGLMITEDNKVDATFASGNTNKPVLVIESIDSNFDETNDIEFYRGSKIVKVDDLEGIGLRPIYTYLEALPEDIEVEIIGRVFDRNPESYTSLMKHSFKIKDLDCSWCNNK